jgi:hypothetical protein
MTISRARASEIIDALRRGTVPRASLDAFCVGLDRFEPAVDADLEAVASGRGVFKAVRGDYGCGKTFMARLAVLDAQAQNFATSFVVVSDNDLKFHKFDDVYHKVMMELGTASCPRGALGDILDRWIGRVEEALVAGGADDSATDFDAKVRERLEQDLAQISGGQASADLVRVIKAIFDLKQEGNVADAGSLISWLCGSDNVGAGPRRAAGIRGEIGSRDALDYLRGVLAIVRKAGYDGLLVVIDEAETILRMRSDSRGKSLNGIRQIADAAGSNPHLIWMFTGTPEFFDTRHGVAGLAPLHDRIKFLSQSQGRFVSLRQPQLALTPFDATRLWGVALKLRDLYPARDRTGLADKVSDTFIDRLIAEVTRGFRGDVGVVPRQFLREFVNQMDLVDEHAEYDPTREYAFAPGELRPEEQAARGEASPPVSSADDEPGSGIVAVEDVW